MIAVERHPLVEQVAEIIFKYESGVNPEEYEQIFSRKQKLWKTNAPWDTNPDELTEWQRDDYRLQATAVLKFLKLI